MLHSGKIAIPNGKEMKFVFISEIIYCKSDSNYTMIYLENERPICLSKSLKEICEKLPSELFFRIHHSHAININYADKFVENSEDYVILKDGTELPVSRRRKTEFLNMFKKL